MYVIKYIHCGVEGKWDKYKQIQIECNLQYILKHFVWCILSKMICHIAVSIHIMYKHVYTISSFQMS